MDTSAMFDVVSWGLSAASVGAFCAFVRTESEPYKYAGIVCAAAALTTKVISVSFRIRAGTELKLAASTLTLTF